MKITIVTISDRATSGAYEDESGPAIEAIVRNQLPEAQIVRTLCSDDQEELEQTLSDRLGSDIILTTGGTGLGPRDTTPEVTRRFCPREVPGIAELLRARSMEETPFAALSRGFAGLKERTLIVNLPGSKKGAVFCTRQLLPVLEHAVRMIAGEGH